MSNYWFEIWLWRDGRRIDYIHSNTRTFQYEQARPTHTDICPSVCVCVCLRVCVSENGVLLLQIPHFSKGGRAGGLMGGPHRDPLEMKTPLQKTLGLHEMEGGVLERGKSWYRVKGGKGYQIYHRVRQSSVCVCAWVASPNLGVIPSAAFSYMLKYFLGFSPGIS